MDKESSPKKTWLERNQILASFFLTTVLGTGVSILYQHVSNYYESQREIRVANRKATQEFMTSLVEVAERRNYYAFRVLSDLDDIAKKKRPEYIKQVLNEDRTKYRKAIEDWNINRHYYERFLEAYVSPECRRKLYDKENDCNIVVQFQKLHTLINTELISYDTGAEINPNTSECATRLRETLTENLVAIYDELLKMIIYKK